ncbi:site-2 protease family protein [Ectothiorhodospiraceae bacterium 2226]|nr:site-2 protease family protein [Ectothiorhodospiraceae bacterium 2226]
MLESAVTIGRVAGIRIGIHYTWFIIFALLTLSLMLLFQAGYPHWPQAQVTTTAVVTSLLFFLSIVLHELGHSLVALRKGIPVRSITLFIFGGVAQTERDAERAQDEFWIAIAGPLVSLALAAAFYVLSALMQGLSEPAAVAFGWLAFINLVVAVFNLIPGFPLDGGRVFRATVWGLSGNPAKGMAWAVMGGRLVAYGLLGVGAWLAIMHGLLLNGLWLAAIAWFLLSAAEASSRDFTLGQLLRGVSARQILRPDVPQVAAGTALQNWVDAGALAGGERAAVVTRGADVVGLVTLSDARKVARERWGLVAVDEVMTPRERLQVVAPDTGLEDVLRAMERQSLNQVPVMEGERLVGWIDRERLMRAIRVRSEAAG